MNKRTSAVWAVTAAVAATLAVPDVSLAQPGLPARVLALEGQVAAHSVQLAILQGRVSLQGVGLAVLRQQVTAQGAELAALRQQAASLAQQVTALGGDVAALSQRVSDSEARIASLQQGADAFGAQLAALADRVSDVETRLATLESPAGPRRVTSVDCDAGESVNAALAGLPPGPNRIDVSGVCPEDVRVLGLEDVWLVGQPGASLRSLLIDQSRRIQARSFAVTPTGSTGVSVRRSSCDLSSLAVDGGSIASGFVVDGGSDVSMSALSAVRVRNGLNVARRSTVLVQGRLSLEGLFPTAPSDGSSGILLTGASQLTASLDGANALRGFSTGLTASENSTVSVFVSSSGSQLQIESNRNGGVLAVGGSISLIGPTSISGHASPSGFGLSVLDNGRLELSNGVVLQGNHFGITLRNNATARIVSGTELTGNSLAIGLSNSSVVDFAGLAISFASNVTDVSCDATSVASRVGLTNATTVSCANQN